MLSPLAAGLAPILLVPELLLAPDLEPLPGMTEQAASNPAIPAVNKSLIMS